MAKEILYTTALDAYGKLTHIKDASKGRTIYCPECKKKFILRKSGNIDVLTTLLLQLKHHRGQVLNFTFLSRTQVTEVPVLTKNTTQVAMRKKDGP